MRNYYLLLMFCTTLGFGQKADLRWSDKIKTKETVYVLGAKDGAYYTRFRDDDKRMIVRKYDKNLNMLSEDALSLDFDSKKKQYGGAYFVNDKIVHFVQEGLRKENKLYLYGAITDLNLKTSDKIFVLDDAPDDAQSFGIKSISPDSTKVLVYHQLRGRKKDPSSLNLKVYNSSFSEIIFEKSVSLPIKSKDYSMESVTVDNIGNVYVLAKIVKDKNEVEKDQSKYSYKLFTFGKANDSKEFDFDYPDRDIESIGLIPGENNTMIVAGFLKILNKGLFGKGKKTLISDELFTSAIDCKTQVLKFAKKVDLEGLYPEDLKKNSDYVPYAVKNIFYKEDGGAVLVAEQYKLVVVTTTTPQGGTTTSYRYYYCDVAVVHMDNKGDVQSVSKLPKYQLNAGNPSILATYYNGNTYVIYEDLERNADAETDRDTKRSTKTMFSSDSKNALMLMTVNAMGEMDKQTIYSYKESKIRPSISNSRVVNKDEIILNAKDQIGVLKFSI